MKADLSAWKDFLASDIYADITEEIEERKKIISNRLIAGDDQVWTDDNMRGRLDELEFISTMANDIKVSMELELNKDENKGSFMDSIFKQFKRGE